MAAELAPIGIDPAIVERVMLHGDLSRLSPTQKVSYYRSVCESVGLNPLTQPFQYLVLNGKEILYARREATEQLRKLHEVSVTITARELVDDIYIVTAKATLPDGRTDEDSGAVAVGGLKGESRANAYLKATTKAKRRVTLSICGLGMLDETEVESLPPASPVLRPVDPEPDAVVSIEPGAIVADTVQNTSSKPPDTLQIVRVEKVATKKANVFRYFVTFSSGLKAVTIQEWLAAVCEQFAVQNVPVKIQTVETKWSLQKDGRIVPDLTKVVRADVPEQPDLEPVTEEDIPF